MAIEAVSSYANQAAMSRPPEVAPDPREAVEQQNDARQIARADQGASPQYLSGPEGRSAAASGGGGVDAGAMVNDPEGSIQRAQTIIQSASSNASPSEAETRRASEAYQAASSAQSQLAQRRQEEGAQSLNVLA
ncbi:MAG TPA: hypothetical protein VL354_18080 [Spirochaetia bacterium]|nr:hypothetical protein [Spirochaetia bacterium]